MFRKIFTSAVIALLAFASYGAQAYIEVGDLSEHQIAELKASAARAVADAAKPHEVSDIISTSAKWGEQSAVAAEGFAKALNIAARELGVTINEFLHTDAGRLTAFMIVWKVAGAGVLKILYGVFFTLAWIGFVRFLYYRLFTLEYRETQYSYLFGMFTGTKLIRVPKSLSQLNRDGEWMMLWIMMGITCAGLGVGSAFF